MISKNTKCPCGSGKLYKRCCGLSKPYKKSNDLSKYSRFDLLQIIAALTLVPQNHGKNVRLEKLSLEVLSLKSTSNKIMRIDDFQHYTNKHITGDLLEDPPGNLFTEIIAFHGGDHLVLPGTTESSTFTLNNLLAGIYNWTEANFPKQFKSNVSQISSLILEISNYMCVKAKLKRYDFEAALSHLLFFPKESILRELKTCVSLSENDLKSILKRNGIHPNALVPFLIDLDDPLFKEASYENNPLALKPIISSNKSILIAGPANLTYALIEEIKNEAEHWKCTKELYQVYHGVVWNKTLLSLQRLGFKKFKVEGLGIPEDTGQKIVITQIDIDKIALVRYIGISQGSSPDPQSISSENVQICKGIMSLPGLESFQFLELNIVGSIQDEMVLGITGNEISQTLMISAFEFDILATAHKYTALDLWKFSLAREKQVPKSFKFTGLSFLDEFNIYKKHMDSFYLSDVGFDISKWVYGNSLEVIKRVKQRVDEHCMSVYENGRLGKIPVERRDSYWPLYLSSQSLHQGILEFGLEGFKISVWVKLRMKAELTPELKNIVWHLAETICYWLWQMTDHIRDKIERLDENAIEFTFELDSPMKFETIDENFPIDEHVFREMKVSSTLNSIHLTIPAKLLSYFYSPKNEGDRLLVRQILMGINECLNIHQFPLFESIEIDNIIETACPLGTKKKLLITHSRNNLLLDHSNLSKVRFLQDYDVSVVADSIHLLLGSEFPPTGEISELEKKKELARKIVMKGLLPHLKETIDQYDRISLLTRLISLNEALIQKREFQKILIPTQLSCFGTQEKLRSELTNLLSDISRTSIPTRCLIEHIAAEPPTGKKLVSDTDLDQLLGIMDAIINWGSIGDQLQYNLFNIRLGILPAKRVGTQKELGRKVLDPYFASKVSEDLQDAISGFEQEFPRDDETANEGTEIPKFLDKAFISEFGISLTRICHFLDTIAAIGFQQDTAFGKISEKQLFEQMQKVDEPYGVSEFQSAIECLSLADRGMIENIPKGFEGYDISPWRFNRRLSLLRRPLIIVEDHNEQGRMIYWGSRQNLLSKITIAEQCFQDRLKVSSDKSLLKKAMSRLTNKKGTDFVKTILDKVKSPNSILDSEVFISKKGKLKFHSDLGDIDVLLIDIDDEIIYNLECKYFAPSRNIKEMTEECDKLLGSKSEKGLIERHHNRHKWLTENLKQVSSVYKADVTEFKVKSAFITREAMLFPNFTDIEIDMPFITQYELSANGLAVLKELRAVKL